jgi:hypothetical protein
MMYDELIKNLRHDSASALQNCEFDFVQAWMHEAADAIEDLIVALTASNEVIAKNKPKWIPVTERLPKEYKYVLCKTDYGMEVGYFHNDWGQDEWTTGKFASGTFDVTHWMPLPKPPRVVKNEDK